MDIFELLQLAIDRNVSDLHIIPGYFPNIRISGELYSLKHLSIVSGDDTKQMLYKTLTDTQKELFLTNKEIDLGFNFNNNRFRINIYFVRGEMAGSFRLIPPTIKTIAQLNLPPILSDFTKQRQGLVLLTGPTGEGKSTTLAALINEINQSKAKHIITIEDPIEFIYPKAKSIISQRELHHDTYSFSIALRSVLREDPDIVLIGEMRDYETVQAALTIAETGHLVLSTLHTKSSPETIDRIVDIFPSDQQNQIRNQLSTLLIAIVSQRLLPVIDGKSQIPGTEILINNTAVASIIRDKKNYMIDNVLETSEESGMILFEKYLLNLCQKGIISRETAIAYSLRPREINKLLK